MVSDIEFAVVFASVSPYLPSPSAVALMTVGEDGLAANPSPPPAAKVEDDSIYSVDIAILRPKV